MTDDLDFRSIELSDPVYELEGLRFATVKSRALRRRADASFWVPDADRVNTLLILLHGVYGSHWVWPMKAGVHRTAKLLLEENAIEPLVIAMPSDGLSKDGSGYLTQREEDVERWIVEEVPSLARHAAPALAEGFRIAISGLSMGGFGALYLGAKYPGRFCAISAHSAITSLSGMKGYVEEPISDYLGSSSAAECDPLFWLDHNRERLPRLRFDCGTDDPLIHENRRLHLELLERDIWHEYLEHPGDHSWPYWQQHVTETLVFASMCASEG